MIVNMRYYSIEVNRYFGAKLKRLREARGLSEKELAEKLNCQYKTIKSLESGFAPVTTERVLTIAKFFGVTPNDLLLGDWNA